MLKLYRDKMKKFCQWFFNITLSTDLRNPRMEKIRRKSFEVSYINKEF